MNIGTDYITGRQVAIADRRRHCYLIGQTGTGKSSLLLEMMVQDVLNGEGFGLLDPHGDLAEAVLKHIPTNRSHQLRYLNPADIERPVGWNPFSGVVNRSRAADEIVGAFKSAYAESWGPRLEHFLINAVRLALDLPKSDLLTVYKLFTDDRFRIKVAHRSSDPLIRSFWQNEYPSYDKRFLTEAKSPILNKLGRVLSLARHPQHPLPAEHHRSAHDHGRRPHPDLQFIEGQPWRGQQPLARRTAGLPASPRLRCRGRMCQRPVGDRSISTSTSFRILPPRALPPFFLKRGSSALP